jgi:integrase
VFQRDDGRAIKRFSEEWRAACVRAGAPGRIPHDFRRTAVRNLVRAGVSEKVALQLTGHKTRSVFDRYDIVNEADLRSAVCRLAGQGASRRILDAGLKLGSKE